MDNTRIPFEAYKGTEPFIFVSYAHKDSDKVFPIISEFHKAGFPIWYDEGIDPGNEWPTEIANALLNCSLFIVFISSFSKESKNVIREINYALSKDKPFIHIWLEETTLNPGLEMQISTNQGIMLFRMEPENFYRKCRQTFEAFKIKKTNARAEPEEKSRQDGEASSTKGKLTLNDGDIYEGDIVDGKPHGKGKLTSPDGDVYEGDFVNGKPNGKGKYTYADGGVYEGDYVDGKRTGKGKETSAKGYVYEGDIVNDKPNGKGKLTFADGAVYEGDFVDVKRTGKGKYTFADGDVYEGDFVDGRFHGKGKLTYKNGKILEGIWKNGKYKGK